MLETINRVFIALLMFLALVGILVSILVLGIGIVFGPETIDRIQDMDNKLNLEEFPVLDINEGSPYKVNVTITTPPLTETSFLVLKIYGNEKSVNEIDCLYDFEYSDDFIGLTEVNCLASIPYTYEREEAYKIYAVLDDEYVSNPIEFDLDWSEYEEQFWGFSSILFIIIVGIYAIIVIPITLIILDIARNTKHKLSFPGEYSLHSLLHPFANTSTLLQKFYSFIVSPYFWAFEFIGIILILSYMLLDSQAWKSSPALAAFFISGLAAFIIPFLWCAVWWFVDFKEREPIRILITLFFWGMLSALMAIGLNTVAGIIFGIIGLGFLSSFLSAPIIEETYKGSGLALLSEHHEFDSVEDGIVFGFVVGMGFAFIENWIYFLNYPMGSDMISWLWLFFLRSVVFSAMHGFYTAITGLIVSIFIIRKFRAPGLAILIGIPIAALFHAMHNSSELLSVLFGGGGILLYCCLLIPLFDYGGVVLLMLLFIRAVFSKKEPEGIPKVGEKTPKPEFMANVDRKNQRNPPPPEDLPLNPPPP
ncbi:MAG: PrsW family intramembrane metalloprotease [Candidatus Micrarchaeota archaeon]